jgi:hypothetical protein
VTHTTPQRVPSGYTYLDTHLAIELPAELPGSEPSKEHQANRVPDDLQRQIDEQTVTIGQQDATILALKRDIENMRAAQIPQQERIDQLKREFGQEQERAIELYDINTQDVRHWREVCNTHLETVHKLEHDLHEKQYKENIQYRERLKSRVDAQGATIAKLQADLDEKREENLRLASELTRMIQNAIAGLNVQLSAVSTNTPAPSAAPSDFSPAPRFGLGHQETPQKRLERLKALNKQIAQKGWSNSPAGTPTHHTRPSSVHQSDAEAIARGQIQPPGPNPVRNQGPAIDMLLARDSFTPFNTTSDRRSEAGESGFGSSQRTPSQITPTEFREEHARTQRIESGPRGQSYHGYNWETRSVEIPPGAQLHNLPSYLELAFQSPNLQPDRTPAVHARQTSPKAQPRPSHTQPAQTHPAQTQPTYAQPTHPRENHTPPTHTKSAQT